MMTRYLIIFLFVLNLFAIDDFDDKQVYFLQTIQVDSCDSYGWCKLKGKQQYIKKQYYKLHKNGFVSLKTGINTRTWTYVEHSYLDDKPGLEECVYESATDNEKTNIQLGYIKIQLIKRCQRQSTKQKENNNTNRQDTNSTQSDQDDKKEQDDKDDIENNIFIDGAIGVGIVGIENRADKDNLQDDALDTNGLNLKVGIGYRWSDEIYNQLEIDRLDLGLADIDNIYISLNYRFFETKLKPYLGIMLGASVLKWQSSPMKNYTGKQIDSSKQTLYGVKFGLSKNITKQTEVYMVYRFLDINHRTTIEEETIKHKHINSLLIGVRYDF